MSKSNTDIIKENIIRIMNEKGITQTELAAKSGISQPRVSAALALGNSNCFTAEQIIKLASKDVLNCSTDEILLPPNGIKDDRIETLSDALEMLFKIDEFLDLTIGECQFYNEYINGFDRTNGVYSDYPIFETILEEWKQLKETTLKEPLKSKIIKQWQEDTLKLYKNHTKKDVTGLPFD